MEVKCERKLTISYHINVFKNLLRQEQYHDSFSFAKASYII